MSLEEIANLVEIEVHKKEATIKERFIINILYIIYPSLICLTSKLTCIFN